MTCHRFWVGDLSPLSAEGSAFALPMTAYALDIDGSGDGWVRVMQPGAAGRVDVRLIAGLASGWDGLPDGLRHGILRLLAHLHAHRDGGDDAGPPPAVIALLRPFRRTVLS